jgi:hypothetical protein
MIYMLYDPTDFLTTLSGFRTFANLLFGANGTDEYMPELGTGTTSSYSSSSCLWDGDLGDGFDSGSVAVTYDANFRGGDTTLAAGDATPVSHNAGSGGRIGSVILTARASTQGEVDWCNITVTFYWDGASMGESVFVSDGPSANASNTATGQEEQILTVTPQASGYDRVVLSGTLRMQGEANVWPGPADLLGQILIMPEA